MKSFVAFVRGYRVVAAVVLVVLILGIAAGWMLRGATSTTTFRSVREVSPEFKFIAPFLYLEVPESTQQPYLALKDDLTDTIAKAQKEGKVSDAAIYVRDMNSGQWVGVNATHKFALASMLKVVTVITTLHQAEIHPATLADSITISPAATASIEPQGYAPPTNPVELGKPYTLEQLFWHDIVESDNVAERALESFIGLDTIKQTYADLRIPVPPTVVTDIDTPQEYSHLFRVLYGATYLTRENSQALLELLSRTTFTEGLVAGVPAGTTVSHKFGENLVPSSEEKNAPVWHELHDCGIVYYPEHPYFICVTTKGDDFPTLASVIKNLSATTWKQMDTMPR